MSGGNGGNTPFVTAVGRAGADGMVDRVARAIEATSNYVISQHHAKALARAAIAAMREPDEAMVAVTWNGQEPGEWRLMIDAALTPAPDRKEP